MPAGGMIQLPFSARQYITIESFAASKSSFSPVMDSSWQSSSLLLSDCLTGVEWQSFVSLLIGAEACLLELKCMNVCDKFEDCDNVCVCAAINKVFIHSVNQPQGPHIQWGVLLWFKRVHRRNDADAQRIPASQQVIKMCVCVWIHDYVFYSMSHHQDWLKVSPINLYDCRELRGQPTHRERDTVGHNEEGAESLYTHTVCLLFQWLIVLTTDLANV